MRYALLLAALAAAARAAPAPPHRPKPPPEVTPGVYELSWHSLPGVVTLLPCGASHSLWGGTGEWHGRWHWEAKTRTLRVIETRHGDRWEEWQVALDGALKGEAASRDWPRGEDEAAPPRAVPVALKRR